MSILPQIMRPVLLAGATLSLSACMYADGTYGDGYVNGAGYLCDPYDPYDAYYSCDYGYGFANIGFGGGWYDNFYYPGYGFYIFDRVGHRFKMKDHHRRYWGHRRHQYGQRHAHRGDRGRHSAKRMRHLSPEQRAERRESQAERIANMSPEERAEWRERRADHREHRRSGEVRGGAALSQQDIRHRNREVRREMRRGDRQGNIQRGDRRGSASRTRQPTMVAEQPQRARPAVREQRVQRPAPRSAPAARAPVQRPTTVRSTRHTPRTSRHNVKDQ